MIGLTHTIVDGELVNSEDGDVVGQLPESPPVGIVKAREVIAVDEATVIEDKDKA